MSLVVRGYNVLFGDCILISWTEEDRDHHAWIDFGNFPNDRNDSFQPVFDDVLTRTDGVIDLMLVTHRHMDHLEGFYSLRDQFAAQLEIKSLWHAHVSADIDNVFELADQAILGLTPNEQLRGNLLAVYQNNYGTEAGAEALTTKDRMTAIIDRVGAASSHEVHRESDIEAITPPGWDRMRIQILAPEQDSSIYLAEAVSRFAPLSGGSQSSERVDTGPGSGSPFFPGSEIEPVPALKSPLLEIPDFARLRRQLRTRGEEILSAVDKTRNNTSIVTRWTYQREEGTISLLLTGDAEEKSWETMLHNADRDPELTPSSDFIKVAHHGSINASPADSFDAVFPEKDNHKVLISTDPTRFTDVNEVPKMEVIQGWRSRVKRSSQLKQTSDTLEGEPVSFRLD